MNEVKIQELVDRCLAYLTDFCYTRARINRYKYLWRNGIIHYMADNAIENYSQDVGANFVSTCHFNGIIRPQEREKIRSVQVLDDMLSLGYIRRSSIVPNYYALNGEIGLEMEKLISYLTNLRRSEHTIDTYRRYLYYFLNFLTTLGIKHVNQITENHIFTFFSSFPVGKNEIVIVVRKLFKYWNEEHIVDERYDYFFDKYKVQKREKIPSYFSVTDVQTIEQSISRSSAVGKRNYAMLLLASRLGLRASDIANLKFSDIDWDRNIITLVMIKTDKIIELPLLTDVGNAIVDYIQNGRPKSKSQNVFLECRHPYIEATSSTVTHALGRAIKDSGVEIANRHHGVHSLRHSLASTMLNDGSTIPVISETLGHRNTQTTMTYIKIDIKSLIKCALPVPPVPNEFYMQDGGAYYV